MQKRLFTALRRISFKHTILAVSAAVVLALFLLYDESSNRMREVNAPTPTRDGQAPVANLPQSPTPTAATPMATTPDAYPGLQAYPGPQLAPTETLAPSTDDASSTPDATEQAAAALGIWISPNEVARLPMEGEAWAQLYTTANQNVQPAHIYDKDDDGDVIALARALVYVRTGDEAYRNMVLQTLQQVMEEKIRPQTISILSVARNLPSYIIAADLVALRRDQTADNAFKEWLRNVRDTEYSGEGGSYTIASCHETRPNNFGSHCGAARVALALYLHDDAELARAADVFHGWLGNRDAYANFTYGRLSWQADPQEPVAINPPGTLKEGRDIGGALPEEMRRGGDFRWPPKRTGYVWEAMQGAIVQAELLARAGYPAWEWEEQALLRAATFLYELDWQPNGDDTWQPWLLNHVYDAGFPATAPARAGKNMGWTDWTHAAAGFEAQSGDLESVDSPSQAILSGVME